MRNDVVYLCKYYTHKCIIIFKYSWIMTYFYMYFCFLNFKWKTRFPFALSIPTYRRPFCRRRADCTASRASSRRPTWGCTSARIWWGRRRSAGRPSLVCRWRRHAALWGCPAPSRRACPSRWRISGRGWPIAEDKRIDIWLVFQLRTLRNVFDLWQQVCIQTTPLLLCVCLRQIPYGLYDTKIPFHPSNCGGRKLNRSPQHWSLYVVTRSPIEFGRVSHYN